MIELNVLCAANHKKLTSKTAHIHQAHNTPRIAPLDSSAVYCSRDVGIIDLSFVLQVCQNFHSSDKALYRLYGLHEGQRIKCRDCITSLVWPECQILVLCLQPLTSNMVQITL